MLIKKISIKNFRSIENCRITPRNMNVFSGCNDSGKSNLLKALNLFFNNQTDHNTNFDFETDFCHFSTVPNKTAKEIKIELTLSPPSSYRDSRDIVWRKKWREDFIDAYEDKMFVPPSPNTQVHYSSKNWAKKIRYRYVPAMKGDNYFPHLLRDLHNTMAISIDAELKGASEKFVETITDNTATMMEALNEQLHIGSRIQLPENLSSLFEVLDFGTNHNGVSISINKRGDGIKVRHIPSILAFLHEEENRVKTRGSVKVNTIWGYEEPENNLEFLSAFSKSDELLAISEEIQMFISSHSPAFYGLKEAGDNVRLYYTTQDELGTDYTQIKSDEDIVLADENMGLLPIVAPYIKEKENELRATRDAVDKLKESQTHNADTLYVEGETDKLVIKYYLESINAESIDIEVRSDVSAGSSWVRNNLLAWALSPAVERTSHKAYGMLDKDKAGKSAHDSFIEYMAHTDRKAHEGKVKSSLLTPPPHIVSILRKPGFKIDFSLEELFPPEIWDHAMKSGWLVERSLVDCYDISRLPNDKSLAQVIDEEFGQENSAIYVRYRVAEEHKRNFSRYITKQTDPSIFEGVKINIDNVIEFMRKGRS
ncbi:ATP-dependent nuclease [Vreelandella neptunia]|uniref:AAA family ATPase n=1 Tax=Vreelandella neptunia TaxID=115551 RepID=A0ABZ0YQF7_9GAMM|nr:AAA family ATPase [Halomonas neptunia]MDN3558521.1 AAA family ATPase [Halomonas neptunia]WQH13492.1 AAA family ATPase [Halomonas neptunia]